MARAIEQIERDIAALEAAVKAIATELYSAYASYLQTLGQALRQHLILASYQLCTQGYPEPFVNLPFNQRQQLQQAIRKLGQNTANELLALTKPEHLEANHQESEEINREAEEIESSPLADDLSPRIQHSPSTPQQLAQWQQQIEAEIADNLRTASREANLLLQRAGILPKKLTPPLLEAAATASETAAEITTAGPPNILNLLVEAENQEQPEAANVTQIIAIHLRLAEIEFADATVRAGRNQIRHLEARLRSLGRDYQKKQQEWLVAEAEAAWRTSWFDDE